MPGDGNQTAGAACGFYCAASQRFDVDRLYSDSSLLALNFNSVWCNALNRANQGERLDYFAMQHSDIEPETVWLDKLIDELDSHDLDVLGVVSPIKTSAGLTSTAVARDDGDTWRPQRRLTMSEVYDLPETFTSDDVAGSLLLNSGLWVAKFDLAWAKKVHFTINDRIVFDQTSGMYRAEVEPEDWYFSRLCHELGLRIGVTRKVSLLHSGIQKFTNQHAWGSESTDSELISAQIGGQL